MDTGINPFERSPVSFDREASPFRVIPAHDATPLVFSSPHSGRHYPEDLRADVDLFSLRRFEDTDVDRLLEYAPRHGATVVAAGVGRAYLDLNRSPDDLDPAMFGEPLGRSICSNARVAAGLGIFVRYASGGREIYRRKLSLKDADQRIQSIHAPYHEELQTRLDSLQADFGGAILIDWHSMPSAATSPAPHTGRKGVDAVLGDRHGRSCRAELTSFAESALRALGLTVARNSPYAGGYTTERHGIPVENRHALQIELSRSLYLDEATLTPTRDFAGLQDLVTQFTSQLATEAQNLIR